MTDCSSHDNLVEIMNPPGSDEVVVDPTTTPSQIHYSLDHNRVSHHLQVQENHANNTTTYDNTTPVYFEPDASNTITSSHIEYQQTRLNYEKQRHRLNTPTKIRAKRKSTGSAPLSSIPLTKIPRINQSNPLNSISPSTKDTNLPWEDRRYHTYTFKSYTKSPLNPDSSKSKKSPENSRSFTIGKASSSKKQSLPLNSENHNEVDIDGVDNSDHDHDHDQDDQSSGFIVGGGSAYTYSQESPFPFRDLTSNIQSPHEPPYPMPEIHPKEGPVRQKVINQNNARLFAPTDHFQEYIEDRLIRWRPTESQHNIETAILGKHPLQTLDFDKVGKKATKSFKLFSTLGSWFNSGDDSLQTPIEEAGVSSLELNSIQPSIEILHIKRTTDTNHSNYDKIIGNLSLKPNSSMSILPNSAPLSQRSTTLPISNQPSARPHPTYTPRGIPFRDYEINFEKVRQTNVNNNSDDDFSLDTLDDDIRHLVDGIDNFVFNCFDGIYKSLTSIVGMCM